MRKLSLFSGVGGIDLAAHWAAMETVAFCEREPFPQKVLQKNFPGVPIYDDVCTLTADRLKEDGIIGNGRTIDIISAGFPCQPFSHAGSRKGADDERYLWPEVVRVVADVRPTWFVGENVAGLLSMAEPIGRTEVESRVIAREEDEDFYETVYTQQEIMLIGRICKDLEDIGYEVQVYVLPAASVGSTHKRDRTFIVAYASSERLEGKQWEECKRARNIFANGCKNVAHSASIRRQRQRESIKPSYTTTSRERETSQLINVRLETEWSAQSRVGGNAHELPNGLDGYGIDYLDDLINFIHSYPQPALMGMPQYDWEPPRVATGVKDRTGRLKALGNAVDPLQIYPIMAAIKAINDQIKC